MIEEIVDVTISQESVTVKQTGFGTGLVLATHLKGTARVEYFSTLAALGAVHPSTSEAYKAAEAYFAQSPAPNRIAIGRRQVDAASVSVVTVANLTLYRVTINGVNFDYTSDASATATEIRDGLIAAVNGGAEPVTAAIGDTDTLTLTHDTPGTAWSLTVSANLVVDALTAVDTIAEDLTAIANEQPDFYGVVLTDRTSADMQAAAAWVEANKRVLFSTTEEADVVDVTEASDTTSLAAILKDATYRRSPCIYHGDAAAEYPDAALMGRVLALVIGSYTAMFKNLAGIPVSTLTATQSTNARDKKCNVYEEIAGVGMVREGTVPSGAFIDDVIGIDWLEARIAERVFAKLAASPKVPYTDAGVQVIVGELKAQLQQGIDRGLLVSYEVTFPRVADVSPVDKGNRLLPDVNFTAVLAGAIHKVIINGVVTV